MDALKECEFWKNFSGLTRGQSNNKLKEYFWIARTVVKCIAIIIRSGWFWRTINGRSCDSIALFFTQNQKAAIISWYKTSDNYKTASNELECDINIPWGRFAWLCLLNIRNVVRALEAHASKSLYYPWIEELVRYEAGTQIINQLFERVKTKSIVIANDHSGILRAVIRAAKEKNIRIIYTQHATVGRAFPALDYDLTMLDGLQAVEQYCVATNATTGLIVVTGRESSKKTQHSYFRGEQIGIATNNDDSIWQVLKMIIILKRYGRKIILRPHPGDNRKYIWRTIAKLLSVDFHIKDLDDFFSKIKIMITGLSGIVVDAGLRNIPSIIVTNKKTKKLNDDDYYLYKKYRIASFCNELSSINSSIILSLNRTPALRDAALMYDAGYICKPDKWSVFEEYITSEKPRSGQIFLGRGYLTIRHGDHEVMIGEKYYNATRYL